MSQLDRQSLIDILPDAEELFAERDEIAAQVKALRALYGGNGYMGERMFKMDEARIAAAIRAKLRDAGEKTTEPQIDALTRTHDEYRAALLKDLEEREKWVALEERLATVEWRLRCRNADASLLAAEARLQ